MRHELSCGADWRTRASLTDGKCGAHTLVRGPAGAPFGRASCKKVGGGPTDNFVLLRATPNLEPMDGFVAAVVDVAAVVVLAVAVLAVVIYRSSRARRSFLSSSKCNRFTGVSSKSNILIEISRVLISHVD